jgi:hypothetical protein
MTSHCFHHVVVLEQVLADLEVGLSEGRHGHEISHSIRDAYQMSAKG